VRKKERREGTRERVSEMVKIERATGEGFTKAKN
jgi:hypothetical protein